MFMKDSFFKETFSINYSWFKLDGFESIKKNSVLNFMSSLIEDQEKMFAYLVGTFQTSALISLGVMKNPMSNQINQNLDQALYYIGLIEMLEVKTASNLTEYEKQILINTLSDLKIKLIEQKSIIKSSEKKTKKES